MRPVVALAYSPVLLEQLADSVVQKHFVVWMERHLACLEQDAARWDAEGQAHNAYLARFYLEWGRGTLPVNTSGGGMSEAYVHGFNLLLEGVRQIRGTSTSQVEGANVSLVTSGEGVPTSAVLFTKAR